MTRWRGCPRSRAISRISSSSSLNSSSRCRPVSRCRRISRMFFACSSEKPAALVLVRQARVGRLLGLRARDQRAPSAPCAFAKSMRGRSLKRSGARRAPARGCASGPSAPRPRPSTARMMVITWSMMSCATSRPSTMCSRASALRSSKRLRRVTTSRRWAMNRSSISLSVERPRLPAVDGQHHHAEGGLQRRDARTGC